MPQDPFTRPELRPPRHGPILRPATLGALIPRSLPGVTPEHTPCLDSPGPWRRQSAEAPRGLVSSLFGGGGRISLWKRPAPLRVPQTDAAPGREVGVGGDGEGPASSVWGCSQLARESLFLFGCESPPPPSGSGSPPGGPVLILNLVASARREVQPPV